MYSTFIRQKGLGSPPSPCVVILPPQEIFPIQSVRNPYCLHLLPHSSLNISCFLDFLFHLWIIAILIEILCGKDFTEFIEEVSQYLRTDKT